MNQTQIENDEACNKNHKTQILKTNMSGNTMPSSWTISPR
jgi:hypothetical protein